MRVNIVRWSKLGLWFQLQKMKDKVHDYERILGDIRTQREKNIIGLREELKKYQELQREYYK